MTDEPSNYALALSEAIQAGEAIVLYPADLTKLSEYERLVLQRVARKNDYHWSYELDTGRCVLTKDPTF